MKIKIALLGAGRVAQHYSYILKRYNIKNYQIVAVADTSLSKAKKLSKILNCNFYNSSKELYAKHDVDLMLILTPSGLHFQHAMDALKKKY